MSRAEREEYAGKRAPVFCGAKPEYTSDLDLRLKYKQLPEQAFLHIGLCFLFPSSPTYLETCSQVRGRRRRKLWLNRSARRAMVPAPRSETRDAALVGAACRSEQGP